MGKQYGIPGIVPDTKGDGKIDNPQEVYDFLAELPEDSKLKQILQQLAPQASTPAKIDVTDIKALTNDQCEALLSGDVVNKVDSTGKHSYRVSFKNATGMCLTYADCENVETVSYNKSGDTWVYDSTDITNIAGKADVGKDEDTKESNTIFGAKKYSDFNKANIISMLAGDDFVDLGLPSGTLWAKTNVGATNPEDYGLYFSWGNAEGHAVGSGYDFSQTVYEATPGHGLNGNIPASNAYDVARKNYGIPAKLPSKEQFQELVDNCTSEWTAINGVNGIKFTSNINGNSVFFPAAGYYDGTTLSYNNTMGAYFTSSYYSGYNAWRFTFGSSSVEQNYNDRRRGNSARAVIQIQ